MEELHSLCVNSRELYYNSQARVLVANRNYNSSNVGGGNYDFRHCNTPVIVARPTYGSVGEGVAFSNAPFIVGIMDASDLTGYRDVTLPIYSDYSRKGSICDLIVAPMLRYTGMGSASTSGTIRNSTNRWIAIPFDISFSRTGVVSYDNLIFGGAIDFTVGSPISASEFLDTRRKVIYAHPNDITKINNYTFSFTNISEYSIPKNVINCETSAFAGAIMLKNIIQKQLLQEYFLQF